MRTRLLTLIGLFTLVAFANPLAAQTTKKETKITWLGHAAFEITSPAGTKLLIDPFISKNPKTPAPYKNLKRYKPAAILLSHSHADHVGDAVAIAKMTGAKVVGAHDHIRTLGLPKNQDAGGNVGGTFIFDDVTIHLVPAMHGSVPGGRPLGFVIEIKNGERIYHSGDTWIFSDMALIHELYAPTILLMNMGGGPYTENPKVAALAIKKYFRPRVIIPMHFGTFPPLSTASDIEKMFAGDKRLKMMIPGESADF